MKSIKLFLKSEKSDIVLPFAHTEHLQGLFYALLAQGNHELAQIIHNGNDESKYKFFSFGDVGGNSTVNTEAKLISFIGTVEWEIRSMQDEIIDAIQQGIKNKTQVDLYSNKCVVCGYKVSQRSFVSKDFIFRMNSPLTVYSTDETKHTIYYDANVCTEQFVVAVIENLKNKYNLYYNAPYNSQLLFELIGKKHQKIVTTYKNTIVNANLGVYKLIAEPEMLEIAYYSGIGAQNPAGFGFVEDK